MVLKHCMLTYKNCYWHTNRSTPTQYSSKITAEKKHENLRKYRYKYALFNTKEIFLISIFSFTYYVRVYLCKLNNIAS